MTKYLCSVLIYLTLFGSLANAYDRIFTEGAGISENDRGLICLFYTDEECKKDDIKLAQWSGIPGTIDYNIQYKIGTTVCYAHLVKSYSDGKSGITMGWFTSTFKSGQNCSESF